MDIAGSVNNVYNTAMTVEQPDFRRIAVVAHPKIAAAQQAAKEITAFFEAHGLQATMGCMNDRPVRQGVRKGAFDLWVALGGDGTMLRSGHLCGPLNVPILGINMGSLGFLMGIQQEDWPARLAQLLENDYWLEPRMMLYASHHRGEARLADWHVLNEAAIGRGAQMRPIRLETRVDGYFLTTYIADGLIAATATGSTAYALAAGGPILSPELRNILVVPVAPHLSLDRAIVLAEGATLRVQVKTSHRASLSLDGQRPVYLQDGDEVQVRASEYSVHFIRLRNPGYFYENLTSQLNTHFSAGGAV